MNKNVMLGIAIIMVLVSLLNVKIYFALKDKLYLEYERFINLKEKVLKINALKKKLAIDKNIKKICNLKETSEFLVLECKVDRKNLKEIGELLANKPINSFRIKKDKFYYIYVELIK